MNKIPNLGLGLWKVNKSDTESVVYDAIKLGYRYLDCACDYGNEIEVGKAIHRAIKDKLVTRGELWITSKLWNTFHKSEHVEIALQKSLSDLGLDYLDSYLIHFPIAQPYIPIKSKYPPGWSGFINDQESPMEIEKVPLSETWTAMEQLVDKKLVKEIGVCNYNCSLLNDLIAYARIKPKHLQIECHPYLTQNNLIRLAESYGLTV